MGQFKGKGEPLAQFIVPPRNQKLGAHQKTKAAIWEKGRCQITLSQLHDGASIDCRDVDGGNINRK